MLSYRCGVVAVALVMFCSVGCKEQSKKASPINEEKQPKVLATVNGVPITEVDLAFKMSKAHGTSSSQQSERGLDDVIKEELLYQQGIKLGLDKDPGYKAQIDKLEHQLANMKRIEMTRRVFNTQIAAKVNITNKDVKDYYTKNESKITTDLHLGMLTFSTREAADEALKKIRGGAKFEAVAAETAGPGNPRMPGNEKPWDMGYTTWDQIPIDFVETAYRLKPGEVSNVVSMKGTGFYIFKLFEARKNPKADLAGMSGVIMNRFREQRVADEYTKFEEQLKRDAKIERF
jgi:peptidyl-prolyl cis-trans isomerase C